MLRWKIAATTAGVVALGVSAGAAIDRASDHTAEVARAAALVRVEACRSQNAQSEILRSSLRTQLQLTESRFENGQLTRAQYVFSRRVLTRNIARLAPQDCGMQAQLIREAVDS